LSPDHDIVLVGDTALAHESKTCLARVGFDRVIGQLRDLPSVFEQRPDLVQIATRLSTRELGELLGSQSRLQLVDVCNPAETADGVIPGAREIPLPALTDSIASLDQTAPVVVYCASGYRSLVAASVLRVSGFDDVSDLIGGYGAWQDAGAA
jgi:rhodanese-related sulfurtransferase